MKQKLLHEEMVFKINPNLYLICALLYVPNADIILKVMISI